MINTPSKEVEEAISNNNRKFEAAMSAADSQSLVEVYTSSGSILPPNSPIIKGTSEIKNFWQSVMDMGIAKSLADDSNLTMAGMYVGTPFYMSPEQCKAEPNLDSRSDVYGLGIILYELLTFRRPFVGGRTERVYSRSPEKRGRRSSGSRGSGAPGM